MKDVIKAKLFIILLISKSAFSCELARLVGPISCKNEQSCYLEVNPRAISSKRFLFDRSLVVRAKNNDTLWVDGIFKLDGLSIRGFEKMKIHIPDLNEVSLMAKVKGRKCQI